MVLRQQNQTLGDAGISPHPFDPDFGPQQGLDPLRARLFVKLDRPKEVVQVGDGQGRLTIGSGGPDDLLDAVGSVDDGEFGVKAQVHEHGGILGPTYNAWWPRSSIFPLTSSLN